MTTSPTASPPVSVARPDGGAAGPARASTVLAWIRRWGISVASFVGGILTIFVFRREVAHVGWIVGYLLLLWLLFALLAQVRQALASSEKRTHRLVVTAADYTIQSLYHGILLFLIPAYYASATLTARSGLFFWLLVVLALLATFDPWYQAIVHPRPWAGYVFFLVSVFGALNLALPLVGVRPHLALLGSAWFAIVALTPAIRRARGWQWSTAFAVMVGVAVVVATLVGFWRAWVPPAPLFLARATLAWNTATVESMEPTPGAIPAAELRERGLIAYTAVYAPAGLRQEIEHVWRREGAIVDVVKLAPVRGGRREGFRTFSRKTAFPAEVVGRWSVDVMTASGQLIGRYRFRVTP